MPNVSGQLLFNTVNNTPTVGVAITTGVPIALVNTSTGVGLVITSDTSGNYQFTNVPAGSYNIIEAYGTTSSGVSPRDFGANASAIGTVTPADPPLSALPSPPAQANFVQSLSPNTRPITVVAADITGQNFIDSPVQDIPITKLDLTLTGSNMLTGASNGTWGSWPAGTAQGTAPATSPYSANVPVFTYTLPGSNSPGDGQYSILNMSNYSTFGGNWYNTSDHTTRNETGRYFLAGAAGSQIIYAETIPVSQNMYYVFSGWIMNPVRVPNTIPSQLTIKVFGSSGQVLYDQSLLSIAPQGVLPIWNESSTLFNTENNTSINFQILSTGAVGGGNDYIIDDLVIQQADVDTILTSTKTVDKNYAKVGDQLKYEIVMTNTGQSTINGLVFADTIPTGTSFVPGTVQINNVTYSGLNPTPPGFAITIPATLISGGVVTVSFSVLVNTLPTPNPIPNTSLSSYYFTPIAGGATVPQNVLSNQVVTTINIAQLGIISKAVDKAYATIDETITYTIKLYNSGNTTADNVKLTDTIPSGTTFEANTVTIDDVIQPGGVVAPPTGLTVGNIGPGKFTTITFQVKVVSIPNPARTTNTGTVTSSYVVDPVLGTTTPQNGNTNIVGTTIVDATLVNTKVVSKTYANVGDTLIYTVTLAANGNTTANNVVFTDSLPSTVTYVPSSFAINGVSVPGGNPLRQVIGNLTVPAIYTITFNAVVNTIPNPNPILNTATTTFTFTVVPTLPNDRNRQGTSNTVGTTVNNASLGGITKSVDKLYADCGDTVTYTINIPNSGNVTATNVVFKDTIPNGTVFVTDSVYVNGTQQVGASPATGVSLGTIAAGATTAVVFSVVVQC